MPESKAPPQCPYCDQPLTKVDWYPYEEYTWNGTSFDKTFEDVGEIKCPHCGNEISEVFPEGIVNYAPEEEEEETIEEDTIGNRSMNGIPYHEEEGV